jgi:hypothetical protein
MTDKPLAEKAATWERPIGSDPRDDVTPPPADSDVVGEDTFIARPDLGVDTFTLVAAGASLVTASERVEGRPKAVPEHLSGPIENPREVDQAQGHAGNGENLGSHDWIVMEGR